MTNEQILDRMAQMIRVGFVNARQPEKMRVKVTLRDTTSGQLITKFLPVLCPRACGDMQYDLPDIGDQVLCVFLSYGLEQGFVLGSMYGKQTPPVQSGDKWHRTFSDGAIIEYDRASHALKADIPGTAEIKCANSIILEAPIIYLRGTLINTARDGSPGKSVFSGGMEVQNGGINVPNGDVIASGVSLASHTNDGVEAGSGTSSHPTGGSTDSPGTSAKPVPDMGTMAYMAAVAASLASLQSEVNNSNSSSKEVDKLILCLPDIAAAMAEKETNEADRQGWIYLHDMFEKWLASVANADAQDCKEPLWVEWNWIMNFDRARQALSEFIAFPAFQNTRNIYNADAQKSLGKILFENNFLDPVNKRISFDCINTPWQRWQELYYTGKEVEEKKFPPVDGLMIAMGAFTIRALASGHAENLGNGRWRITVTKVATFVHDTFNFAGFELLGYWSCKKLDGARFDMESSLSPDYKLLSNADFRAFQEQFGHGGNFLVLSQLNILDNFQEVSYDYSC